MSGTREGGKKTAITNKLKYGADFYQRMGAEGGKKSTTGGFAAGKEGRKRASFYGRIGGTRSKRRPKY